MFIDQKVDNLKSQANVSCVENDNQDDNSEVACDSSLCPKYVTVLPGEIEVHLVLFLFFVFFFGEEGGTGVGKVM